MLNKEIDIQCAFMDVAIMRQLFYCNNKKEYFAGIFVSDKCDLLYDRLDNLITDCNIENAIYRRIKYVNKYEILFKNGSGIFLLKANDYTRGYKFHDIIIDTDIESRIKESCCLTQIMQGSSRCVELEIPKDTPLSCFRYDVWK